MLLDLGTHLVDQALTLFGPVRDGLRRGRAPPRRRRRTTTPSSRSSTSRRRPQPPLGVLGRRRRRGPRLRVLRQRGRLHGRGARRPGGGARRRRARPGAGPWGVEPRSAWGRLVRGDRRRAGAARRPAPGRASTSCSRAASDGEGDRCRSTPATRSRCSRILERARRSRGYLTLNGRQSSAVLIVSQSPAGAVSIASAVTLSVPIPQMIASATPSRAKLLSSPSPALKLSTPASPTRRSLPPPAEEHVVARSAEHRVVALGAEHQVVAAAAGEYVVAGGAGLHAGGARGSDTDDRVGEVVAHEDVVAVAADERAEVGMDDVLFGPADPAAGRGLARVGEDGGDPVRPAVDDVDPLLLDGGVGEGVGAGVPEDLVVAEPGDDRVVAGVAVDHRPVGAPRCCGRRRCCRSPRRRRAARGRRRPSCRRRRGRGSCRCPPACRRRRCRCRPGRPRGSCRPPRCRRGSRRCWSRSGSGGRHG